MMYVHVQRLIQSTQESITSVTQGVDITTKTEYIPMTLSGMASFNSPPWFCKQLPQPTHDYIEIRLCGDESTYNEVL